jgi:hypothetical protein
MTLLGTAKDVEMIVRDELLWTLREPRSTKLTTPHFDVKWSRLNTERRADYQYLRRLQNEAWELYCYTTHPRPLGDDEPLFIYNNPQTLLTVNGRHDDRLVDAIVRVAKEYTDTRVKVRYTNKPKLTYRSMSTEEHYDDVDNQPEDYND